MEEKRPAVVEVLEPVTEEDMTENRFHLGNLGPGDVALLKQVAEEAARKAVHDTFLVMGLEIDDPIQSQQDFVALRAIAKRIDDPECQADDQWVRNTRRLMTGIFGKAILTAVGLAVVGAAHTIWLGITALFDRGH